MNMYLSLLFRLPTILSKLKATTILKAYILQKVNKQQALHEKNSRDSQKQHFIKMSCFAYDLEAKNNSVGKIKRGKLVEIVLPKKGESQSMFIKVYFLLNNILRLYIHTQK